MDDGFILLCNTIKSPEWKNQFTRCFKRSSVRTRWRCTFYLNFQRKDKSSPSSSLTPVGVVQEDELVPVVVVEEGQQRPPDGRPELQGELALALGGEAGRDEGDVQGAAEGCQRVDRALVVQAEDGEDTAGILGTNWGREEKKKILIIMKMELVGLSDPAEVKWVFLKIAFVHRGQNQN